MARNIIVIALVVALLGVAVYQFIDEKKQEVDRPTEQAPLVNFLAPHFELDTIDGETYAVAGERDKYLLVNFWASWCGPCHEEAPDLNRLFEKYSDRLDIYAVNVTEWDTIPNAKAFVETYHFQFPVLYDVDNIVTPLYNVRSYPANFLVDPHGTIIAHIPRMLLPDDIKMIERQLKKG